MLVKYQAINRSGAVVTDTVVADDADQAYSELTRRGLTPVRIETADAGRSKSANNFRLTNILRARWLDRTNRVDPRRASRKHLPFFTAQMSVLLATGTTVIAALGALERQVACPHWRELINRLAHHVEQGGSLASAVGNYPMVFDPVYSNMIAAGESSGKLDEIFARLARLSQQGDRVRSKVISALIYPALLTLIATAVVIVLTFFILPRFEDVFAEMKVDLPSSTRAFLAVSRVVRRHMLLVLLATATFITTLVYWLCSTSGRRFINVVELKLPIIGPLISSIINARIFRLIGLLANSDVPLIEALQLTAASTKHHLYLRLLQQMHAKVLQGESMYEVLQGTDLVPASLAEVVHTAENNGQIGAVLTMLADHLDDQNETKVGALTSLLEPLILVLMGLVIGTVVISLVLPMFDLSRIAH